MYLPEKNERPTAECLLVSLNTDIFHWDQNITIRFNELKTHENMDNIQKQVLGYLNECSPWLGIAVPLPWLTGL